MRVVAKGVGVGVEGVAGAQPMIKINGIKSETNRLDLLHSFLI